MLISLRIKNLALVEELEWNLAPGFIAITGETGAGKSILIGALQLLLGERADKALIRTGADACTVEAVFEGKNLDALQATLADQGIEPGDGQLILKRSFALAGTNRQWINGSPTTLAVLKTLGDGLVDLHGPHDHQSLLSPERQLAMLDAFAHSGPALRDYQQHFRRLQTLVAAERALSTSEAALEQETDLLRYQIREIETASLAGDEEAEIQARYKLASNSKRLIELAHGVAQRLADSDDSVLSQLAETQRLLRELEKIDPAAGQHAMSHAAAVVELSEIARTLATYAERLDLDPAQLVQLENRISLFETLKRKYGGSIPAVIAFGERAAERLARIEGRGSELKRLAEEISQARTDQEAAAEKLRKLREKAAPKLAGKVRANLRDLGFKQSEFEAQLSALAEPRASGGDGLEFLFSPNPGEPLKPLRAIASSGEISRLMLAIKSALAAQDAIPLLVFDEIDANVGGEIAHAVGAKMRALAADHQVLCITHLPQVAAAASTHFVVMKEVAGGRTHSQLRGVVGASRQEEIARMLGGKTDSALSHASTLLRGG